MKSFFRSLFGKRLTQHSDSFALTRVALWNSIAESIQLQQSMGKSVWLVAHFLETFTDCQEMLEQNEIDYAVETQSVSASWFRDHGNAAESQVRLLLADLAEPLVFDPEESEVPSLRIAMMVVERHPFGPKDDLLVEFSRSLPAKVEIGYFLSLDDELVKRMVPPQMIDLMKALGLRAHDLVSSAMVTRRLKKLIERGSSHADPELDAESAAQWFDLQDQR